MSPTSRPSTVAGLRRGVSAPPAAQPAEPDPAPVLRTPPAKPARITLNLPPEMRRDLDAWATSAAAAIDAPTVPVQDALRAMIRAVVEDQAAAAAVLAQLRRERE